MAGNGLDHRLSCRTRCQNPVFEAPGSNGNRGARGSREHCLNSVAGCRNGQEQGCDLCLGNNTSRCGPPVMRERASKRTAGVLASLVTEDLSSLPRQGGCERACVAAPMILPLRLKKSCFGFTGRRFVYYDFKGFESSTTAWGSGWSPCGTQWTTATIRKEGGTFHQKDKVREDGIFLYFV